MDKRAQEVAAMIRPLQKAFRAAGVVGLSALVMVACGGGAPPAASPAAASPAEVASTAPEPAAVAAPAAAARARADASLLPRRLIFGNPERTGPRISHDGKLVGWIAPKDGVLNVYVAPADDLSKAKPVTDSKVRPIPFFLWAYDNKHMLYAIDLNGDENVHGYSFDVATAAVKDLTPFDKTQGRIQELSEKFPKTVAIGTNDRDAQYHDLYRVDIVSGQRTLLQKNDGFADFVVDPALKVRYALKQRSDGGFDLMQSDGKGGFSAFQTIPPDDSLTTSPMGFDESGRTLYLEDSRDRNTSALVALDTKTSQPKLLAEDARADVGGLIVSPIDGHVQAASFDYERRNWKVIDPAIEADLAYLKMVVDGDLEVLSRSQNDAVWTVAYVVSDGPVRYYLYDRKRKKATYLFSIRPALDGLKLAKLHTVVITAREGKPLVSDVSLPPAAVAAGTGQPSEPLPTVLLVHGGPWARDSWGFNSVHQWLATRGYAVLSVNYRGSTGFGKGFVNAGDKEWAGKMHDDLLDAVEWAAKNGIADRKRVAIMGGSYGGYATLVGLTFTPEAFTCGVDIVGPSTLNTLLASIPPYWAPLFETFARHVGDPRTREGKKLLDERSPLSRVSAIARPLLIGQGANDPRVKQAESDQIVQAMKAKGLPVTYVLFTDEGHGFQRPENRIAFFAVAETFLAQHLGGVYQPIGNDFAGASIQVPDGTDKVPGLAEALLEN
jgi:dipeptidyl aminopeptidase/acylaminoacyl peptidase